MQRLILRVVVLFLFSGMTLGAQTPVVHDKKVEGTPGSLTWFELQVCPMHFRLAMVPDQPILIGFDADALGESRGKTVLVESSNRELFTRIAASLEQLVRSNPVFEKPPVESDSAFSDDAMESESVHLRIAFSDGARWAGFFGSEHKPPDIQRLIEDCQDLGRQVLKGDVQVMPHDLASRMVNPDPGTILKVRMDVSGGIHVDGKIVTLDELRARLDQVEETGGLVWYSRENAEREPGPEAWEKIKAVLEEIAKHDLPITLVEDDR